MRRIVLQMMTTLDGRLDDPMAWVHGVSEEQYQEIDRLYAAYDTILVGRTTYEEMAAYWPGALEEGAATETNRRMAQRMRDYRKLVVSRSVHARPTEWHNAELLVARTDDELAEVLGKLQGESGGDILLSGGASLAQSVLALGLVDELQLFVYPVVSSGATWFGRLDGTRALELLDSSTYANGVVRLHYRPVTRGRATPPTSFSELLT